MALEPRVRCLNARGLPKIGSYVAAAAPKSGPAATGANAPAAAGASAGNALASGSYHCILAVDTLHPEGNGQPLAPDDVSFVSDVARALGAALDASEAARLKDAAGGMASVEAAGPAAVAALRKAFEEVFAAPALPEPLPEGEGPPSGGGFDEAVGENAGWHLPGARKAKLMLAKPCAGTEKLGALLGRAVFHQFVTCPPLDLPSPTQCLILPLRVMTPPLQQPTPPVPRRQSMQRQPHWHSARQPQRRPRWQLPTRRWCWGRRRGRLR